MKEHSVIAIMGLHNINQNWLNDLQKEIPSAKYILIIDEPHISWKKLKYDHCFVSQKRQGFGGSRKTSMLLASRFGSFCVVTDGDGQYYPETIKEILSRLITLKKEIIIPQRMNRKLLVNIDGEIIDRSSIELFETLCALELINDKHIPSNLDSQPGLFAFHSKILSKILPDDNNWLADLEITVKAIKQTRYELLPISIDQNKQKVTSFSWEEQKKKFKRLSQLLGTKRLWKIYEKNKNLLNLPEIVETTLKEAINSNES